MERDGEEGVSSDPSLIRVLAVDDHPVFRQGIAGLIDGQLDMRLVGEASNGREGIQQFRALRPDVTLMDLQMPEMNGIDAISAIRGEFPEARIIVLTTYARSEEHTSELQSQSNLVCRLLLEKKKNYKQSSAWSTRNMTSSWSPATRTSIPC